MSKKFFRQRIEVERLPQVVRFKWEDRVLTEGVTSLPKKLVRTLSSVFPGADGVEQLQVALTLVDYRRPDNERYPTLSFLAFLSGLPEDVFERRVEELRQRGLVRAERIRDVLQFDVTGLLKEIEKHAASKPLPSTATME